jgi:hypothetical protein
MSNQTILPPDVGECSACGQRNSHRATRCHACQATLPWAAGKVKTQAPAPVPVPAAAPPATPAAATPPLKKPPPDKPKTWSEDGPVEEGEWWHAVGWGLASLGAAGWTYWSLAAKEASGGWFRSKWWVVLLYSLGGKWLVAGIFVVVGLIGIIVGIMQYLEQKKA